VSSSESTLPVLLSMRNSADYCVLTSSHLYNFYPRTTGRRVNLISRTNTGGHSHTKKYMVGLRSHRSTSGWSEPCGEVCPVRIRQTDRLSGLCILKWDGMTPTDEANSPGDFEPEGTFGEARYKWSLGTFCANAFCPNNGRTSMLNTTEPYYD